MLDDVDIGVLTLSAAKVLTARHACLAEMRPPLRRKASGDSDPTASRDADEHVDDRLGRKARHRSRPDVLHRERLFTERRSALRSDVVGSSAPSRVPLLDMNRLVNVAAHEIEW